MSIGWQLLVFAMLFSEAKSPVWQISPVGKIFAPPVLRKQAFMSMKSRIHRRHGDGPPPYFRVAGVSCYRHRVSEVDVLRLMCERIVEHFQPLKVILFGSRARNQAKRDSDFDLLVVLSSVDHPRRTAIAIGDELSDMAVAKDILVATPAQLESARESMSSVFASALREGQVIYERS